MVDDRMSGSLENDKHVVEAVSDLFKKASFQDWWNGVKIDEGGGSLRRLPLVDVRSTENYSARRIASNTPDPSDANATASNVVEYDSVVVHLPFETLLSGERSCELPPRHVQFAVLTDDQDVPRDSLEEFFGATVSKATQQSRKPWRVVQLLDASNDLWLSAKKSGILEEGAQQYSDNDTDNSGNSVFVPFTRLWQPDPLIQNILLPLLRDSLKQFPRNHKRKRCEESDTNISCHEIWDLGSGAGRDVCFLAEELKRCSLSTPTGGLSNFCGNIKIVGVDNHKASAKRCVPFWKHRQVDDITEALYMNLNKIDLVRNEMKERFSASSTIVCYYAVRFWNRKLVNAVANEENVQQGTLFAMSHFCKPHKDAPWNFDHPKEKNVLDRKELQQIFESTGKWKILHDEIAPDGDHGRTLIQFVAKRI